MNEPVGSIGLQCRERPSAAPAADLPSSGERLHALDAVRGFALLLGIVFHGTGSFLDAPEHMWFIVDHSPSTTLTLLFYVLHIFRMATFFFIAGFFARLMFHRRGERGFVRDRLRRIGLPLLAGWPVLIVLLSACVIWGAWVMNGGKMPSQPPPDPNAPPLAFPLTHLWFLYLLLWFYAITLLVRRLVDRFDAAGRGRARLDRHRWVDRAQSVRRDRAGSADLRGADRARHVADMVRHPHAGWFTAAEHRRVHGVWQRVRVRLVHSSAGALAARVRGALAD